MQIGTLTAAFLEDISSLWDLSSQLDELLEQLSTQIQSLEQSLQETPPGTPEVNKAYVSGMVDGYKRVAATITQMKSRPMSQEPQQSGAAE
jgi:hypothetical protein